MTERKWKLGKVEIVLGHSSKKLKIAVSALLVFSTAALAALGWVEYGIRHQTELVRTEAAEVSYENEILKEYIADLGSVQSVERIAQEYLGMVSPDTILIEAQVK